MLCAFSLYETLHMCRNSLQKDNVVLCELQQDRLIVK